MRGKREFIGVQRGLFNIIMYILVGILIPLIAIICFNFFENPQQPFRNSIFAFLWAISIILLIIMYMIFEHHLIYCQNRKICFINRIILIVGIILIQFIFLTKLGKIDLTKDSFRIIDQAVHMVNDGPAIINNSQTKVISEGYFGRYGNNQFLVIFFYLYFSVVKFFGGNDFVFFARVVNVISIDASIVISYFIAKKIGGIKRADSFLSIVILCPTTYVWLFWSYTNTFSLPFTMGLLLLAIFAFRQREVKRKILYAVLMGIIAAVGYNIRPTVILTVITLCIVSIFFQRKCTKKCVKQGVLWCALFVFCFFLSVMAISKYTKSYLSDPECKAQFPITHWIMMGVSEEGNYNSEDVVYTSSFESKEEKTRENIKQIKKRLSDRSVFELISLEYDKIYQVFGDGVDQYTQQNTNSEYQTKLYEKIYGGKKVFYKVYCRIFRFVELFFVLISVICTIRSKSYKNMALHINILGAVLFFVIWEANIKYSVSFIWISILLFNEGVYLISNYLEGIVQKGKEKSGIKSIMINYIGCFYIFFAAAVIFVTMLCGYRQIGETKYKIKKDAVLTYGDIRVPVQNIAPEYSSFSQVFTTRVTFQYIKLNAGIAVNPDATGYYNIELLDEENNLIFNKKITPEIAYKRKQDLKIKLPSKISSHGKLKKYKIVVNRDNKATNFLYFMAFPWKAVNRYESGDLYLDNNRQNLYDLSFNVYSKKAGYFISPRRYKKYCVVVAGMICMLCLLEVIISYRKIHVVDSISSEKTSVSTGDE